MSVTIVGRDGAMRSAVGPGGALLLGEGDCCCEVRFGETVVNAVFSRTATVARDLVEALCTHLSSVSPDGCVLCVVDAAGDEERGTELDDSAVLGESTTGGQLLVLRKRAADSFRVCVFGPAKGSVFRGWLRWGMTPGEVALLVAPSRHDCALFCGCSVLQASLRLDQQPALSAEMRTAGPMPILLELRPARAAERPMVAIVGAPLRAVVLTGSAEPRCVGVAASPDATGHVVAAAAHPREEELSLVGKSGLINLDEPLSIDAGVALQIKGAHEEQRAVMEAAAAAFGAAKHFNLLRGEEVVHKIANVTHWVPHIGKVLGTLLLTPFRLVFVAHDRSTYSDAVDSRASMPIRAIYRVSRLDSGPSGRFLEILCRNFEAFVFAFLPSKHSRALVADFVQSQQASQRPFALQGPPSLVPPVHELGWLEEQYRRVFGAQLEAGGAFRLSHVNRDYSVCESYPSVVVVPAGISDADIIKSSEFRSKGRFLATVWRHPDGPTITRCSQPMVGLGKKRSAEDEAIVAALGEGRGESVCLIDSRPLANAVANKLAGAGSESQAFYEDCEIRYIGLGNIHVIREAWNKLRALCQSRGVEGMSQQGQNWLVGLHQSEWLQHVQHVLEGSLTMARLLDRDKRSCVTHCSDGWDRTSQLCSLVQLMLDPYYRTLEGFPRLIHKEWLCFGHRFETRSGIGSSLQEREVAPVFLLFLDCVYQMQRQFYTSFEFGSEYLVAIFDASMSGQFGTFLFDSEKERVDSGCFDLCDSVWTHLRERTELRNPHYRPGEMSAVFPSTHLALLSLWNRVYLRLPIDATFERDRAFAKLQEQMK